ncbi:MAG: DUF4860 domain-containing protein [Eubacteriaceae bacterium]|nr:DUF4860 domain-containing protein [Eubacteriaceae bacterium]
MNVKKQNHTVDTVFIITIFLVFVMSTFFVLATGANIYKNISNSINKRFNETTSLSYISNKILSYNERGRVYISKLDNIQALTLEQSINSEEYITMLYYYNGKLMELICKKNENFSEGDGIEILDISGLEFEYVLSDLLQITVYNGDTKNIMFTYLNCN